MCESILAIDFSYKAIVLFVKESSFASILQDEKSQC